jgi:GNAT superfamily N-acetyltransferase
VNIELLNNSHNRTSFICEEGLLTDYIRKRAKQEVKKRVTACYVATDQTSDVVGYYTLSSDSIPREDVPEKYKKQVPPSYSAPVILLGRLAGDLSQKGKGLGEFLLIDALLRCLQLSGESIGAVAVVVDPISEKAVKFYEKYGFIMLPDSGKMFLPMKTIELLAKEM